MTRSRIVIIFVSLLLDLSCFSTVQKKQMYYPEPQLDGIFYKVKSGENMKEIAKRFGFDPMELAILNGIENPNNLKAGTELFIPGDESLWRLLKRESKGSRSANKTASVNSINLIWPVRGVLTSKFGKRGKRMHRGVDIAAPAGTVIRAADTGEVIYSDCRIRGYGNMVIIKHRGNIFTVYAHNSKNLVKKGAYVKQGQPIALVGSTGRSTGPHLHFEVHIGHRAVNPLKFLKR